MANDEFEPSSITPTRAWSRHSECFPYCFQGTLARMFHELLSRGREDSRVTGQPQGVGPEAYLNGTSQGTTTEDGHIRGRSPP